PHVKLLDAPFARWRASGRELFYRPVSPEATEFAPARRPELRALLEDVSAPATGAPLDVRAAEEFDAPDQGDEPGGPNPGAVNVDWRAFVEDGDTLFTGPDGVQRALNDAGAAHGDGTIVYCRSGPRAAVAFVAMCRAGVPARLYVGSFLEWTRAGMPV